MLAACVPMRFATFKTLQVTLEVLVVCTQSVVNPFDEPTSIVTYCHIFSGDAYIDELGYSEHAPVSPVAHEIRG